MSTLRQTVGKIRLQLQGGNKVVGWNMTPEEAVSFFKGQGKTVLTFFGYMLGYENEAEMYRIVRDELSKYSPETALVNDGVTKWGLGEIYPLAKSLGFTTTGIVSRNILDDPSDISPFVDHICFMDDIQWGGKLPNSEELSPTSKAMVDCSDVLIALGGNEVSRDELLAAQKLGKTIHYHPAEMNHENAIRHAKRKGLPPPESFLGAVHEVFGK
jgi:hypothetical protein